MGIGDAAYPTYTNVLVTVPGSSEVVAYHTLTPAPSVLLGFGTHEQELAPGQLYLALPVATMRPARRPEP